MLPLSNKFLNTLEKACLYMPC